MEKTRVTTTYWKHTKCQRAGFLIPNCDHSIINAPLKCSTSLTDVLLSPSWTTLTWYGNISVAETRKPPDRHACGSAKRWSTDSIDWAPQIFHKVQFTNQDLSDSWVQTPLQVCPALSFKPSPAWRPQSIIQLRRYRTLQGLFKPTDSLFLIIFWWLPDSHRPRFKNSSKLSWAFRPRRSPQLPAHTYLQAIIM